MNNDTGVVREVLWAEICPCLVLLRVFRISTRLQALLLAAVGAVTMTAGWRLADRSFLVETSEPNGPTATEIAYLSKWPGARTTPVCPYDKTEPAEWNRVFVSAPSDPVISLPYRMKLLTRPIRAVLLLRRLLRQALNPVIR